MCVGLFQLKSSTSPAASAVNGIETTSTFVSSISTSYDFDPDFYQIFIKNSRICNGEAQTIIQELNEYISSRDGAAKEQALIAKKWLEFGCDPSLLITDFEGAEFAVSTKLIDTLCMYQASAPSLEGEPMGIRNIDGMACVLKNGAWDTLTQIKSDIGTHWSDRWSFVHPLGFVEQGAFNWQDIRNCPIAQLNHAATEAVFAKSQAKASDSFVLMPVVTRSYSLVPGGLFENFGEMFMHSHAFMVDRSGTVWSVGTLLKKEEFQEIFLKWKIAKSCDTNIKSGDYELPRSNSDHFSVYLPMDSQKADACFDYINDTNRNGGMRFNLLRQNCVRFSLGLVDIAKGMPTGILESILNLLPSALPDLQDIPLVGTSLDKVAKGISWVTKPVFSRISSLFLNLPDPIVKPIKYISRASYNAVCYIPKKLLVFSVALTLVLFMGASEMMGEQNPYNQDINNKVELTQFERLYRRFSDLFDEDRIRIYSSYTYKKWMESQGDRFVRFNCRQKAFLPIDPRFSS